MALVFNFSDFVHIADANGRALSISFTSSARQPVQQRPKFFHRRVTGGGQPVMYDPSGCAKTDWRIEATNFFVGHGVAGTVFPTDSVEASLGICLTLNFYVTRCQADYHVVGGVRVLRADAQRFPHGRDLDNLIKFLMDAMQPIIFENDNCITALHSKKLFVPENRREDGPYTEIQLSLI